MRSTTPVQPPVWLTRDAFLSRAQARGITIDADQCPAGLMVDADETVLTGMVHSLMDNALTFTSGGRIASSCSAHAGAQASSYGNRRIINERYMRRDTPHRRGSYPEPCDAGPWPRHISRILGSRGLGQSVT